MRQFSILLFLLFITTSVQAQSVAKLQSFFEGKQVTLRIDMPRTSSGVNVYPERAQALDYREYSERIGSNGIAIQRGTDVEINKLKIKNTHIEFQLQGRQANQSSRFNIHFSRIDDWMLTPATIIDALRRYVQFSYADQQLARLNSAPETTAAAYIRHKVVHVGPRSTYLREGISEDEALRLLGEPVSVSTRRSGGEVVSVYEFRRGDGRMLIAEFAGGKLIRSRSVVETATSLEVKRPLQPE